MLKKVISITMLILIQFLVLVNFCSCTNGDETQNASAENHETIQSMKLAGDFSFENAAVTIPSPASVHLESGGRFAPRFEGNSNYLHYLHEHYGQEMVTAFAARNYAACHVCSPTRASILSGKYPARLQLTDWLPGRRDFAFQQLKNAQIHQELPLDEITLAEELKSHGYTTAIVGKWHLVCPGLLNKLGYTIRVWLSMGNRHKQRNYSLR